MLKIAENIALQNVSILYSFVLRAEICTTFRPGVKLELNLNQSAVQLQGEITFVKTEIVSKIN